MSSSEDYVMNFNTNWNVGSKEYAGEFVTDLIKELKERTKMSKNEIIDKILELKMKKKQTQKDKLQIQKLQQQLIGIENK